MDIVVPKLPPVIQQVEEKQEERKEKLVVILHTRDVSEAEENLCRKFGRVRHYNPSMINRDLQTVPADYLFCDVRDKVTRIHIGKLDANEYNVCAYVNSWEKLDNIFDDFADIRVFSNFPDSKVTYKEEFDSLLCDKKKIKAPNSCLSFLSCVVNIWDSVKKH